MSAEGGKTRDPREALRELVSSSETLQDVLKDLDHDKSGSIDNHELYKGLCQLGYQVSRDVVNALFDELDTDRSGKLEIRELKLVVPKSRNEVKMRDGSYRLSDGHKGALPTLKLDPYHADKSISEQLREYLAVNKGRVQDLFRSWDEDGNGNVSKEEFYAAMCVLGAMAHKNVVDGLFDSFDTDGSGEITFSELDKLLRGKKDIWMEQSLAPPKGPEYKDLPNNNKKKKPFRHVKRITVSQLCDKLGYIDFPSIAQYLQSEHGRNTEGFTTVPEARVEYMLHHLLPMTEAKNSPNKANQSRVELEDELPGPLTFRLHAPPSMQPKPPKPVLPIGESSSLDLGPKVDYRWKQQVRDHWGAWEKRQHRLHEERTKEFQSRRPWHTVSTTIPPESVLSKPHQSPRERQLHQEQLRRVAGSPLQNAHEEREAFLDIWPKQQEPSATLQSLRRALTPLATPRPAPHQKLAADVIKAAEQTAFHTMDTPLQSPRAPGPLPKPNGHLITSPRFTLPEPLGSRRPVILPRKKRGGMMNLSKLLLQQKTGSQSARPHYREPSEDLPEQPHTSRDAMRTILNAARAEIPKESAIIAELTGRVNAGNALSQLSEDIGKSASRVKKEKARRAAREAALEKGERGFYSMVQSDLA